MATTNAWATAQYAWVQRFDGTTTFDNDDLKKITNGEYTNNVKFSISGVSYNNGLVNKWLEYSQLDRYGSATSTFSWSVKENANNPYSVSLSKIQCNIRGYQATLLLEAADAYFTGNSPVDYNTNGTGEGSSKIISTTTNLSGSSTTLYMSCQYRKTTFTLHNIQYTYKVTQRVPKFQYKAVAIASPNANGTVSVSWDNVNYISSTSTATTTTTWYDGNTLSVDQGGAKKTAYFKAVPADGYLFAGWSMNGTDIISTEPNYSVSDLVSYTNDDAENVKPIITLYAIFTKEPKPLKIEYAYGETTTFYVEAQAPVTDMFQLKDVAGNNVTENAPVVSYKFEPQGIVAVENGVIKAVGAGVTKVTAWTDGNEYWGAASKEVTLTIIKYTPAFTWNAANTPYYYGTSIPNIFSTTNPDVETTFTSDNEAFARVENNTLYIANVRETATITVEQKENYKWYGKSEQYVISPVNGNNHVPFTIDSEAKFNTFKHHTESGCKWSSNRVRFEQGGLGFNWDDNYYDIHFEGIPDKLTFNFDADDAASGEEWYVQESSNGTDWSSKTWSSTSNSGSASVTLQSSTRYLRLCYSGNLDGYISNIKVTERFQFEVTPMAIDFGTNGINHGQQEEEITFLHTNAGRITKAVITGDDAKYFTVTPELIPGTGRDLYGSAKLKVTFDNLGKKRGTKPYNATLTISDNVNSKDVTLTGVRDGKSTPVFVWNPNAMPYYFNTTIANIAYSTNRDAKCPLTFHSSNETIAKVENGDLYIYGKGQEVTITVSQTENADYLAHEESFTFTPCERPSLEVPFRVSQALHNKSVQLGTKCKWLDDTQIQMADPTWDGFLWGDARKRVLVTFAGVPDKLYFEFKYQSASSITPATPEDAAYSWIVEESPNGVDWTEAWKTSTLSTDWKSSGEIDLKPNTQFVRFNYKGNFAGYIRNIIISSLEGNSYLRAEEGGYLSRGAKWGTQAIVDPFGMVCRVSHFTVDNTNIYTRFQFIDNMQYLWETHDTKELFTDDQTAANTANLWQIESVASGKFTIQSGNDLGNKGNYVTINEDALTFTTDPTSATIWHMETPAEHNAVVKNYMDAAAAKAAEKDFGSDINTLEKVRSNLYVQDFEITEITVPDVAPAEQTGEYRDGVNGTLAVYDDTISGLKPGFYRLTVKALYRISDSQKAQAAKTNGWESVLAYIYANDVKYPVQSVYTSYNAGNYDTSDDIYNGYSYPAQLNSAKKAFEDANRYLNDVYVYVEADPEQTTGTLRYGIKNPSYVPGAWLAYETVTLTRFGRKEYIFQGTDSQKPTDWHTGGNWNRDAVPNQYHNVRIAANANISTPVNVYGLIIEEGNNVHITSSGGLTIGNGGVREAHDECITIDNLPEGAGFLRVAPNATTPVTKVKVNYATEAYNSGNPRDEVWQYVGAPGAGMQMNNADNALIYHWNEQEGWVKNSGTSLDPFVGYALTQDQARRGEFEIIATPIFENKKIDLTLTPDGMNGDNLFVNSYLSPIDVARIEAKDYNDIEGTFYLFNSGSWRDWQDGDPNSVTVDKSPGQYFAITPRSAALIDANEDQTTIPPMQGAYVIAKSNDAWIKLDYKKHVYDVTSSMNRPMRAPQLEDENFMRVRLQVNSPNSGADRMYVIQYENTTRGYDNGYDAKNIIAQGQANIYTNEVDGQMEISVADQIDSTYIGFAAGEDSEYTLTFTSLVGQDMYLHDLETDSLFLLAEDQQYTFAAQPNSVNDMRFQLLLYPDLSDDQPGNGVTTGVDNTIVSTQLWVNDKRVYIIDAHQNSTLSVYTANGISVTSPLTIHHAPCTIDLSHLPTGVYVLRLNDQAYKFVCK